MKYETDSPHGWHSEGGRGGKGAREFPVFPFPSPFRVFAMQSIGKLFLVQIDRQFILGTRNEFANS